MTQRARAVVVALAIAASVAALAGPAQARVDARQAASSSPGPACQRDQIVRAGRCVNAGRAARHIVALARQTMVENDLKAVILRVDVGNRTLVSTGLGQSMAGVPATRRMHFRIGSMAIPYLTTLLLQLQDKGRLSIDDRLSKWFPELPNADRITLKMLANSTSGYADYVQRNPEFVDVLLANVFKQWTEDELLAYAFAQPAACEPGTCFNYSHANFIILGKVLRKVTGRSVARLMRRRILRPLGLRNTHISALPAIPRPALHAYSSDRGVYEDSTFWSPSWTIGRGVIMTSTVRDVVKSAAAIGTGRLLSRRAAAQQVAPFTVGLSGMTPAFYYGLGINVVPPWRFQNPFLNGYSGAMAYLPPKRISIAVASTKGEAGSRVDKGFSEVIFAQIGNYLAPEHPVPLPP